MKVHQNKNTNEVIKLNIQPVSNIYNFTWDIYGQKYLTPTTNPHLMGNSTLNIAKFIQLESDPLMKNLRILNQSPYKSPFRNDPSIRINILMQIRNYLIIRKSNANWKYNQLIQWNASVDLSIIEKILGLKQCGFIGCYNYNKLLNAVNLCLNNTTWTPWQT